MMEILIIFGGIIFLFGLFLFTQSLINRPACALCAGVFLTWLAGLILFWLDQWDNLLLPAVLLGASLTGLYYTLEKKLPADWRLFRLPIFLTLLAIAYLLLGQITDFWPVIGLLLGLWSFFFIIHQLQTQPVAGRLVKKLLQCCRDW